MKTLTYNLSLNIINKNIKNTSFFLTSLEKPSEAIFVSKKALKKINLIPTSIFLHHPTFLLSFSTKTQLKLFWSALPIENKKLIEYINYNNLKFNKSIDLVNLFTKNAILINLSFYLKLSLAFFTLKTF